MRARDLSIITFGAMVHTALDAAKQLEADGVQAEVLDLRSLAPLDRDAILTSVAKTSRALLLYEAPRTGGIGGELAAIIAEEAFEYLDAPIVRIASADAPVPYAPAARSGVPAERREKVVAAGEELGKLLTRSSHMATNVVMPQMGESIAEGTIVRWIKKIGEAVDRDEPLFEISTDKVDAEIPSPGAGVLTEIKVKEGETVPVNSVVAVIGEGGRNRGASPSRTRLAGSCRRPAGIAGRPRRQPPPTRTARRGHSREVDDREADEPASKDDLRRQKSSPLVRRIAREHNVDIQQINGTGISGRVTKSDILDFIESGKAAAARGAGHAAADPPARSRLSTGRPRRDRADDDHAAEDRRAHGAQRPHVAARLLRLRGELRHASRSCASKKKANTSAPAAS